MSTTTEIEINKAQKIQDPRMDDSGDFYFSTFQYRVEGDIELYGDDEWRTGKIIWETIEGFNGEDESEACDWDDCEINDEYGVMVSETKAKEVSALM